MALGVGLDAVFADNSLDSNEIQTLRLAEIEPNKLQPRRNYDERLLRELADSIKEHGLIQPIIVRPTGNGMTYQIVAGERRWRACRILQMNEIPVIIKELSDMEASQVALIENVQREDLNPVDEANAYQELIDSYGMTQESAAAAVGKSRSYVANSLRLLNLPDDAIKALKEGKITVGHAKALLAIENNEMLYAALDTVISDNLNVRQTEKLVKNLISKSNEKEDDLTKERKRIKNLYTETEIRLREKLGRRARINGSAEGKGMLSVEFYNEDDLYHIASSLVDIFESDKN